MNFKLWNEAAEIAVHRLQQFILTQNNYPAKSKARSCTVGSPFSVLLPFFPLCLAYVSTATLLLGKLATLLLLQCDLYLHFSACAIMTKCRKQLTFSMNFLYTERDKSMTTRNLRYLTTKILIAKKISPPSPIHCYYLK